MLQQQLNHKYYEDVYCNSEAIIFENSNYYLRPLKYFEFLRQTNAFRDLLEFGSNLLSSQLLQGSNDPFVNKYFSEKSNMRNIPARMVKTNE